MNQLCRVCDEPAAGFHFGAFTCEGCKSFFGRTCNNVTSLGDCKNAGKCEITRKNRTACKACRLRKCVNVGMSKSGSRYGRRSNWFKIHCLLQDQANTNSPETSPTDTLDKLNMPKQELNQHLSELTETFSYKNQTGDSKAKKDKNNSVTPSTELYDKNGSIQHTELRKYLESQKVFKNNTDTPGITDTTNLCTETLPIFAALTPLIFQTGIPIPSPSQLQHLQQYFPLISYMANSYKLAQNTPPCELNQNEYAQTARYENSLADGRTYEKNCNPNSLVDFNKSPYFLEQAENDHASRNRYLSPYDKTKIPILNYGSSIDHIMKKSRFIDPKFQRSIAQGKFIHPASLKGFTEETDTLAKEVKMSIEEAKFPSAFERYDGKTLKSKEVPTEISSLNAFTRAAITKLRKNNFSVEVPAKSSHKNTPVRIKRSHQELNVERINLNKRSVSPPPTENSLNKKRRTSVDDLDSEIDPVSEFNEDSREQMEPIDLSMKNTCSDDDSNRYSAPERKTDDDSKCYSTLQKKTDPFISSSNVTSPEQINIKDTSKDYVADEKNPNNDISLNKYSAPDKKIIVEDNINDKVPSMSDPIVTCSMTVRQIHSLSNIEKSPSNTDTNDNDVGDLKNDTFEQSSSDLSCGS